MSDPAVRSRINKLEEVLRQVPYQYQNKNRLKSDVASLLQSCRTLQPQLGNFSGGGRTVTLFYLYGVLPINYNGSTYNIPVTIYFDPPYPRQPPRCFVTPTTGMALKTSHANVDAGGMVYVPYLAEWNESRSTIPELIGILSSTFAAAPPVYATNSAPRPAQAAQATQPQQNILGGIGEAIGGAVGGLFGAGRGSATQPAAVVSATAVPAGRPYSQQSQPVATVVATPVPQRNEKEELSKQVVTSLKDRWPIVVEPLTRQLNEQLHRRRELEKAQERLEEQASGLKKAEEQAVGQEKDLRSLETELQGFVEAESGREINTEAMLESLDPERRQVLDCLSEELALDEMLTALDELLAERKIGVDDFMREVRDVSRRQFMCKTMRQKAAKAVAAAAA